MMTKSAKEFARLLRDALYRIRDQQDKSMASIQDELGYALGRETGGSAIEYWRKGNLPAEADLARLATELVKRGGLKDRSQLEQFLRAGGYPHPTHLLNRLFPTEEKTVLRRAAPVLGRAITDTWDFFGRERELKRIFNIWEKRSNLQHIAIIGPKRSGKTSLVYYLKNITIALPTDLRPGQKSHWLSQPELYRWVFVDFRDARMRQQESLLRHLLTELELRVPAPCDLINFTDLLLANLQTPTIILMDDIREGLTHSELDSRFWDHFRALANNPAGRNLGFLITADANPMQLAEQYGRQSPFFNIFGHTLFLDPFTPDEAAELVRTLLEDIREPDLAWITAQSKRWPCTLQVLCHALLTARHEGRADETWKAEGLRAIMPMLQRLEGSTL